MKISCFVVILCISGMFTLRAAPSPTASVQQKPSLPAPTAFHIVETGPNHRLWQRESYERGPDGQIAMRLHQFTQLESGMNYLNAQGQWTPSQEIIESHSQGAIARQGQYQVIFGNNLNSYGAIDLQTPDGKELRSNILGLGYYDSSTGQAVLIAQVKDSFGTLSADNRVLYVEAFDGIKADVQYSYRKSCFEQDVILQEQPPTPESLGLNPATTKLEVFTEFLRPPQATVTDNMDDTGAALDQNISWGATQIGHGRAFDLSDQPNVTPVSVEKRYITIQGRQFLIEMVPLKAVANSLDQLPTQSSISQPHKTLLARSEAAIIPAARKKEFKSGPMKLATLAPLTKGYVLDYIALNVSQTNYCFRADMTYSLSGNLNLTGVTTLEGGTVLKFDTNNACSLNVLGTLNCLTAPYQPAIFTTINDTVTGEDVLSGGSSGPPCTGTFDLHVQNDWGADLQYLYVADDNWNYLVDGEGYPEITSGNSSDYSYTAGLGQHYFFDSYDDSWNEFYGDFYPTLSSGTIEIGSDGSFNYSESGSVLCTPPPPPPPAAVTALSLANGGSLHDVFFRNVSLAVDSLANCSVWDAQFIHCGTALKTEGAYLYAGNILMSAVGTGFSGQNFTAKAENLTFDQGSHLTSTPTGMTNTSALTLVNGLLTGVTDLGNVPTSTNFVANLPVNTGVYQIAGAGSYYLPTNSIYRQAGTNAIDPELLAELKTKTTCPPVIYSNTTIAGGTYPPQAQRDTNTSPALGYHYEPLDYCFSGVNISTNILFPPGTAVGYFDLPSGGYGIGVPDSTTVTYSGTLAAPCVQARYSTVQEGNGNWAGPVGQFGGVAALGSAAHNQSLAATIDARFTLFASLADQAGVGGADTSDIIYRFTHCVMNSGRANSWDVILCFTNCLFVGVQSGAYDFGSASSAIYMQNCTTHEGLLFGVHFGGSTWPTRIQNSAFENVDFSNLNDAGCFNTNISYSDYNAFVTNQTRLPLQGTHDVIVTNFNWQTSWLGDFYLPTNSPLINAGYATADLWGLYHFTTQVSQIKETNSIVDVGYHEVAADAYGNPVDSNGDGMPDYLEDANGNGTFDGNELVDWRLPIYRSGMMQFNNGFGINIFEPKPRSYIP